MINEDQIGGGQGFGTHSRRDSDHQLRAEWRAGSLGWPRQRLGYSTGWCSTHDGENGCSPLGIQSFKGECDPFPADLDHAEPHIRMQRCDYLRRCRSISIDSAQEGLTNALRHADTRLIKIILDIQPTTMSLAILDDGVSLPMQVESSAGMVLKLLRYRANLLRARIRIQPGSTRGTHLIFTIEQQP
jgi:hypothetical protein